MPERIELLSIVDYGHANPAINTHAFLGPYYYVFWSVTPGIGDPSCTWCTVPGIWTVEFLNGIVHEEYAKEKNRARCVR